VIRTPAHKVVGRIGTGTKRLGEEHHTTKSGPSYTEKQTQNKIRPKTKKGKLYPEERGAAILPKEGVGKKCGGKRIKGCPGDVERLKKREGHRQENPGKKGAKRGRQFQMTWAGNTKGVGIPSRPTEIGQFDAKN